MAKSKKTRQEQKRVHGWHIPPPTHGDAIYQPDKTDHIMNLMRNFAFRSVMKQNASRKQRPTSAQMQQEINYFMNMYQSMYQDMYAGYCAKLNALPGYPSQDELDAMDCIDVSSITGVNFREDKDGLIADGLTVYLKSLPNLIYASIPCFEKGCLYMSQSRRIYFEIRSVDLAEGMITLFLRDYIRASQKSRWNIGISGEVTIDSHLEDDLVASRYTISEQVENFTNLYTRIPAQEMHWNQQQIQLWEQVLLQNAVDQKARFNARNTSPMQQLSQMFHHTILISNFFLSKYRPKLEKEPVDPDPKANTSHKTSASGSKIDPSKPRVRTVGTIRFVSAKPPKQASQQTIRHYTMASWPTRGHTRVYKSGKTVYIKPSVHHRKVLNQSEQTPAQNMQSIIRIKDTKA